MKRNNLSIGSEQEHLSLAVLRRYQEGALPAPEEHRVEKHVLACGLCADILAGMEARSARQTAAAVGEIHLRVAAARERRPAQVIPLFSRRSLAVAAAVLLLLCSAGVVFLYNLEQVKQKGQAPVAVTPPKPVDPKVPVLQPAPASPPVAPARPPAPPASTPAAAVKREGPVAVAFQPNKLPGQAPAGTLAGATAEDIVVEVLPAHPQGPAMKPDSGFARIGAVAAAPATAAPAGVLGGRVAGVSVEKEARKQVMTRVRTADASAGQAISGQVSDAAGQPLPGVTVLLKGTTLGTVTDQQGRYSLPLPQSTEEATLAYHFIGYSPLEKKIKPGIPAAGDVALEADNKALSEVVVVGYGEQKNAAADVKAAATPVGGWSNYKKHLQANLRHPTEDGRKVSGRVVVGFTVNPDGSLADVRVLKSLSAATDAEALRLVQQGPRWQPAKAGDKAAPQPLRVTIRFRAKE